MSIGILGKKLGMSQLFDDKGNAVPVTLIEACLLYTSDAADD